jgi:hypothetical protein
MWQELKFFRSTNTSADQNKATPPLSPELATAKHPAKPRVACKPSTLSLDIFVSIT